MSDIIASSGGLFIPCPSTGVNLTIEFNESVSIVAADPGMIDGTSVTINADDLEDNPTTFEIVLELGGLVVGDFIILSANYTDDQGNDPDLFALTSLQIGDAFDDITPSPTVVVIPPSPTAMPTPSPIAILTPSPSAPFPEMPTFVPTFTPTPFSPPVDSVSPTSAPTSSIVYSIR